MTDRHRAPAGSVAAAIALLWLGAAPRVALGQDLASRMRAVRDGVVRMSFEADPDVCGDGKDLIGRRRGDEPDSFTFTRNNGGGTVHGVWNGAVDCVPGPVRISVRMRGGSAGDVQVHVAGGWPSDPAATDLGRVDARDAADALLGLAHDVEQDAAAGAAMLAASLAADAPVTPGLQRIATDSRADESRRALAEFWLGQSGEADAVPALSRLASEDSPERVRRGAIFALAQHPAAEAGRELHAIAADRGRPTRSREEAIFWVAQREDAGATPFLLHLFRDEASKDLRKRILFSLSQIDDPAALDALMDVARREDDHELRRSAIFWIGQSDDPRAAAFLTSLVLPR